MRRWALVMTSALLIAMLAFAAGASPGKSERSIVELWEALNPLTTVTSIMNTGAHPDDERSAFLAYYALGHGSRTSTAIANRGEGGQNSLGNEYVHLLGVLRTRELAVSADVINVRLNILNQGFGDPIWDFGFSKSVEETVELWGGDHALGLYVKALRAERPDVVYPSFDNVPSQHGHHRAANVLTVEAFRLAADPNAFPEHFEEGLHPWQPRKLYLPVGEAEATVTIPVGEYNPIYGRTYEQLGEESRYMHISQNMGREYPYGPSYGYMKLIDSVVEVADKEESVFDGLPYNVADLAAELPEGQVELAKALHDVQAKLDATVDSFPSFEDAARNAHDALVTVRATLAMIEEADLPQETKIDLQHRLRVKEEQLAKVSLVGASIHPTITVEDPEVVRGQQFKVTVSTFNGGNMTLQNVVTELIAPEGWIVEPVATPKTVTVGHNETAHHEYLVTITEDAEFFNPYDNRATLGKEDPFRAKLSYTLAGSRVTQDVLPDAYVAVLPDYSVSTNPANAIVNTLKPGESVEVQVSVRNYLQEASSGVIRLKAPEGWKIEPAEAPFTFENKGETASATFQVTPPAGLSTDDYTVVAEAVSDVGYSSHNVHVIDYEHIGRTYLVEDATVVLRAFPLAVAPVKVGYVASGFDSVPEALRLMGVDVTLLTEEDLLFGDLNRFDTIVVGIYAYGVRPDLDSANPRLLEWVRNGGNMVVLNHRFSDNWKDETTAPYFLRLGRPSIEWRVTDETAPVEILVPDHPVVNWPNKIEDSDWDHWVKDRGFHFPMEWSDEYVELFAMTDPGEEHRRDELKGNTLWARYGEGTYLYSSLIWYFQLDELVPGAFRMMANFISQPMAP